MLRFAKIQNGQSRSKSGPTYWQVFTGIRLPRPSKLNSRRLTDKHASRICGTVTLPNGSSESSQGVLPLNVHKR